MAPWADVLYAMDRAWWKQYQGEAQAAFTGQFWTAVPGVRGVRQASFDHGKNSGLGAIALAEQWGAHRVILLGYDCQKTGGAAHWHDDHPNGLGNAGSVDKWPAQFEALSKRLTVDVVNCTRETALTCFPRQDLAGTLSQRKMPPLFVRGMHGLGDNLHQRAIIRQLAEKNEVWLETPWPCLYHDMPDVHMVGKGSKLRTQAKNAQREVGRFTSKRVPRAAKKLEVSYPPADVRKHGSVLAAMAARCEVEPADFRLPIPPEWEAMAVDLVESWKPERPIMIYRPLIERSEWGGCKQRNPDHKAYAELFRTIRDDYFVVSVADLEHGKEWKVGEDVGADVEMHRGELDIEILAALMAKSALVYSSPGFAVVLAQAVRTPVAAVFGGYENSQSFAAGSKYSPYLGIDPIKPCQCFSHTHQCAKRIDIADAKRKLSEFVNANYPQPRVGQAIAA